MPRNISFAKTTQQFRERTKSVTRRKGWRTVKPGQILNGCVKCMGLKPGESIERLGQIRVTSARREALQLMADSDNPEYGNEEAIKEGFPELTGVEFVEMFCRDLDATPDEEVTRIEFEYL